MGKLTALQVKHAQPQDNGKPKKHNDGQGLYLLVNKTGKYWRYDYQYFGKRKTFSIGTLADVSLSEARIIHQKARLQLREGVDPNVYKQQRKLEARAASLNTFESVALEWYRQVNDEWGESNQQRVTGILNNHLLPQLGKRQIAEIKPGEVLLVLRAMEKKKLTVSVRKAKQIAGQVFRFGVVMGFCERDVTADLRDALKPHISTPRAAITDPAQLGDLLRAIDAYGGSFITVCALKLSVLTMVRPGNISNAEWSEFDFESAVWTIPAAKLKLSKALKTANRPEDAEKVPLSTQAIDILESLKPLTARGAYVFAGNGANGRPMSENTVNKAIRMMGFDKKTMCAHGFRTTASTMLNTQGYRADVIEKALFHKDGDKIRAIYNRADYLQERRGMLQSWADYLDGLRSGADVIPIKRKQV